MPMQNESEEIEKNSDKAEKFSLKDSVRESLIATIFVLIAVAMIPIAFNNKIMSSFEHTFTDFQVTDINYSKLRVPELEVADTNIVLVDAQFRSNLAIASLLNIINAASPKIIAVEKFLNEEADTLNNLVLADAIKNSPVIILPSKLKFDDEKNKIIDIIDVPPLFKQDKPTGYIDIMPYQDKSNFTVREFYPHVLINGNTFYSIGVVASQAYDGLLADKFLVRNNTKEVINYRGDYKKFYVINADNILSGDENLEVFRHKLVILGDFNPFEDADSIFLNKQYFTPLNDKYTGRAYPDMSGTEIQANIVSMILQSDYFYSVAWWVNVLVAYLFCFFTIVLFLYIRFRIEVWYEFLSLVVFVLESVIIVIASYYLYHHLKFVLDLNMTVLMLALASPIFEAYDSSIKPVSIKLFFKLFKRGQS